VTRRRAGRIRAVLVAAAAAMAVAIIGGSMTELGPWYRALAKPAWQPPDPAFGVIWTVIFALAAASGAIGWRNAADLATREWVVGLFALNGFLNVLWSLLFFRLHRPDWALIEVAALWLSISVLILFLARVSRTASALLAPYIIWVSIAAALNYEVVRMNPPFSVT
jgi:tryptophan-rich sensory protein